MLACYSRLTPGYLQAAFEKLVSLSAAPLN
jgi:hypothetical protein